VPILQSLHPLGVCLLVRLLLNHVLACRGLVFL